MLDDSTEVDAEPEVAPSSIQVPTASPTDEPLIAPALHQRILPDNLIDYTSKPRQQEACNTEVSEFIAKISKPVHALVPTPATKKRRQKTVGPVSMPRRSH